MSQPPDHQDIMQAIHHHDVRLVRLEGEVVSLQRDVTSQAGRMDRATLKLEELAEAVAALSGGQRLILLIVGIGIPAIMGLELWNRISG